MSFAEWYEKNKEHKRQRSRDRYNLGNDRLRALKDVPCMDCGIKYPPYVMEFDHREDKKFNLSRAQSRKRDLVEQELAKCDIVCSNCHRVRTYNRRNKI